MPGRGNGQGGGRGQGSGRGQGGGRGMGAGRGFGGPGGNCVCPACGETQAHVAGKPCLQQKCPKCGAVMVRQERLNG